MLMEPGYVYPGLHGGGEGSLYANAIHENKGEHESIHIILVLQ